MTVYTIKTGSQHCLKSTDLMTASCKELKPPRGKICQFTQTDGYTPAHPLHVIINIRKILGYLKNQKAFGKYLCGRKLFFLRVNAEMCAYSYNNTLHNFCAWTLWTTKQEKKINCEWAGSWLWEKFTKKLSAFSSLTCSLNNSFTQKWYKHA